MMTFEEFFKAATGHAPYDYQRRLAGGGAGRPCESQLINVPTGLGKTAAGVLAWLWNRLAPSLNSQPSTLNQPWPRRLVYCLPMRTLVEQTQTEVQKWLQNLLNDFVKLGLEGRLLEDLKWLTENSPVILMGGEDTGEWDVHPEKPAILIGTQDMLLSRALNRGYAAGRARWPKDFALLNNDCLWVFDEVQLMSTGFATSLQLQSWRNRSEMRPAITTASWWMSATVEREWLASAVDFAPSIADVWNRSDEQTKLLWNEDTKGQSDSARRLKKLLQPATKTFHAKAEAELKDDKEGKYTADVTAAVKRRMAEHGGKTLVILNTVRRACALAAELRDDNPLLLHSRFRHRERKAWTSKVKDANLIVATQVIEAGLDITSRVLFSESCPWPSFIQRCGRAARYADDPKADVYWLDVTKDSLPYSEEELAEVKAQFASLTDVSLASFREHRKNLSPEAARRLLPYAPRFVPQAKDILDLFDTTPDLTGADIDISRYIRDGEEHDITVFWRDCSTIPKGNNPPKAKAWQPEPAELCPVPVFSRDFRFRDFAQKTQGRIWRWDYRDGWTRLHRGDAERIFPGQVFLLEQSCGGYDPEKGWTGRAEDCDFDIGPWKRPVPPPPIPNEENESTAGMGDYVDGSDGSSDSGQNGAWRTILHHSREVCEELHAALALLLPNSDADEDARVVLPLAGRLHDWGKAHAAFKQKVEREELKKAVAEVPDGLPAKAPDHCWRRDKLRPQPKSTPEAERDARRAGFRHELASGLAILELLRRHQPNHPALAWPDEELRAAFDLAPSEPCPPLADSALAAEIAALTGPQFNLLIYLVAAHHGKVRLSLRSSPDDLREDVPWPCPPETRQARGVREGDSLPDVALPGLDFTSLQVLAPAVTLHLDVMDLGLSCAYGPSWRERTGALLAAHGPFRLAWYEAILRVADQRASRLAQANNLAYYYANELAGQHPPLAAPSGAAQTTAPVGGDTRGRGPEHGLRGGASGAGSGSRDTRPDRATRFIETTLGRLSYSELAPLLGERVALTGVAIYEEAFAGHPLDESLIWDLHSRICGDLVPEWAGRWRAIEVRVGNLQPPPPHEVPLQMRDYVLDLQVRWDAATADASELTLELLAFAEGRFLTIHPFQDFNGRTIRLFLLELLRRMDLPRVLLAPQTEAGRANYFSAIEAADARNWHPLMEIWRERLANAKASES